MKHRIIYILLLVTIVFCSCDEYLDVEPKGKVIPTTINDYDLMLNLHHFASDIQLLCLSADDYQSVIQSLGDLTSPDNTALKQYTWQKDIYKFEDEGDLWADPYNNIYTFNVVLSEIDKAEGDQEEVRERVKAEARTLRAYNYYILINSFAPQYDVATADANPGVFLNTKPIIDGIPNDTRVSIQEIYDFILTELTESVIDLPTVAISSDRPSKATGYAILARTYLQMGDYENAKLNATKALSESSGNYLGDYTLGDSGEYIAEQFMIVHYEQTHWLGFLSDDLASMYDAPNDARIGLIWDYKQDVQYDPVLDNWIIVFSDELDWAYQCLPNGCVSVPEMYLIRAECNARLASGSIADVLVDLNELGVKRFYDYTDIEVADVASKEAALLLVLEKRRKELAIQANRWFDLKRLNKEPLTAKTITHHVGEETYTLAPNANNYVYPIPFRVLSFLPNLENLYPRDDNASL